MINLKNGTFVHFLTFYFTTRPRFSFLLTDEKFRFQDINLNGINLTKN